jgi:hypothetical protein
MAKLRVESGPTDPPELEPEELLDALVLPLVLLELPEHDSPQIEATSLTQSASQLVAQQ